MIFFSWLGILAAIGFVIFMATEVYEYFRVLNNFRHNMLLRVKKLEDLMKEIEDCPECVDQLIDSVLHILKEDNECTHVAAHLSQYAYCVLVRIARENPELLLSIRGDSPRDWRVTW